MPSTEETSTASITADALIEGLLDFGILDEPGLVELLGPDRYTINLNNLEMRLVNTSTVSEDRLIDLIGSVSGLLTLTDGSVKVSNTKLSKAQASNFGALVLDIPDLTVGMVEDTQANRQEIADILDTWAFNIVLLAAPQFDRLFNQAYNGTFESQTLILPESIFAVLDQAVKRDASDVHLGVGEPPIVRVDSALVRLETESLTGEWCEEHFRALCDMGGEAAGAYRWDQLETRNDVDFAITYGASRFRVNLGRDRLGYTGALRKIPTKLPNAAELGLPSDIVDYVTSLDRGLVLVTGPTGSGKTTTNAALMAEIADRYPKHILTLEDPVEYVLPSDSKALVRQRELGASFSDFGDGLRQALRQDPDVILVGELRDRETMETALHAAETGHLVFGTLHTVDAPSTVARIVTAFPGEEQDHIRSQLAYILKAVVAQTLLPKRSGNGRVAAFEIMKQTPAIMTNLSKEGAAHQLRQAIENSSQDGMQTLDMHLAELVKSGVVSEEVAALKAPNVEDFYRRVEHNA